MSKIKDTLETEEQLSLLQAETERNEKIKSEIRLATADFCYINFYFEGTPEEIISEYHRVSKLYKGTLDLSDRGFQTLLDRYLVNGDMNSDEFDGLGPYQSMVIDTLRKSFARIKRNNK